MNSISIKLLTLWAVVLLNTGCSFMGAPRTGLVLNLETKEPIPDAVVVVLWEGIGGFIDATSVCYHVMTDTSNKNGRFYTGIWFGFDAPIWGTEIMGYAYKEGYIWPRKQPGDGNEYLIPFRGTREERFAYLERMLSATNCADAGVSYKNLYRIRKAIYEEAMKIAVNDDEKKVAWGFGKKAAKTIETSLWDKMRDPDYDQLVRKVLSENP